jgi:hypothetical protein
MTPERLSRESSMLPALGSQLTCEVVILEIKITRAAQFGTHDDSQVRNNEGQVAQTFAYYMPIPLRFLLDFLALRFSIQAAIRPRC